MIDTWAKLVALPNPDLIALVEFNLGLEMPCGTDWTSEGSNTYSHACTEESINACTDDGAELVVKTSIALVKATAGTYYFDLFAQKIYVHAFDDDDLSSPSTTITIVTFLWKYFSSKPVEFEGHQYYPLMTLNSLQPLSLSVDDVVDGTYKFNFGSFNMSNDGFFDKASAKYIWHNRRVLIKLGGESLPYGEYKLFFVGRVSDIHVADEQAIFSVKDIRVGTFSQIPIDHYWKSNHPNMADTDDGKPIPIFYGQKENIIPVCIDPTVGTGGKWKIAGRKIKEIVEIRKNDTVLSSGTDYTEDLPNAEFTLNIAFSAINGDVLEVDAKGFTDNGTMWYKGADIAKDILKTYLGFIDDDLDLQSFIDTNLVRTYALCIYLDTDISSREVLQTIGRSIIAFFSPTEDGKLSFEAYEPTVPAGTLELFEADYRTWKVTKDHKFVRNKVKIQYDQNPSNQKFKKVERNNYKVLYKYGVRETLSLKTYIKNKTDAETIAEGIRDMVSKPITTLDTTFGVKGYTLFPTRKLKVTKARAADESGSFDAKVFRIKNVSKNTATESTRIEGMDDLQTLGESFCYVCFSCQKCVNEESGCSNCYTCQNCYTTQAGCQSCDVCQLCVSTQSGCVICNTCENCNACQVTVGSCETCETCNSCELCNVCESNVAFCVVCEQCFGCQLCNVCEQSVTECEACELCDTCESCNTCQVAVGTCGTCQNCVSCQSSYSSCPGSCDSCNTCQACNSCQDGVQTCTECQQCYSCDNWYTCNQCDICETCNICQKCNTTQDCTVCDVCDSCEKCNACENCFSCQICNTQENP